MSYEFKKGKLKWLPLNQMQVYLYANNIGILWKANKKGLDPDYNDSFTGVPSYPSPRTIALGLKTNF